MNHELKISYQKPAGKPMPIDPLTIERHLTLALFQHYGGSKNTSKSTLEESYKLKTDAQLPTETKNPLAKKTHIPQPKPIINEPNYGDQPILNPNFIKDYCEKGDLIYIGKALQNKVKEEVKDPMTHSSGAVSFRVNELDEYLIGPKNIIQKHMQTWALNEKGAPHFKVLSEEKTFLKVRWIYNGSPQLPPYRQGTWDTLQTFLDAKKSSLTAGIKKGAKNKKK